MPREASVSELMVIATVSIEQLSRPHTPSHRFQSLAVATSLASEFPSLVVRKESRSKTVMALRGKVLGSTYPVGVGIDFAGARRTRSDGETDLHTGNRVFGMARTHRA